MMVYLIYSSVTSRFLFCNESSTYLHSYASIFAVARIALVKPEKARGVEDVILRAAQMGQIVEKVAIIFSRFIVCVPKCDACCLRENCDE